MSYELAILRAKIDTLDAKLLKILAQRMKEVEKVGKTKKAIGVQPLDTKRWANVLKDRELIGSELGLSAEFIDKLFNVIHDYALEIEKDVSE